MFRVIFRCSLILLIVSVVIVITGQTSAYARSAVTIAAMPSTPQYTDLRSFRPNDQATISVDMLVQMQVDDKGDTYSPIEGWLTLSRTDTAKAMYTGTFVDNFGGGKTYPVSWTPAVNGIGRDGLCTLNSHVGKIVYKVTNSPNPVVTAVAVPKVFGTLRSFTITSFSHVYTTDEAHEVRLTGADQNYFPLVRVQLTITYDALNYIVKSNPKTGTTSTYTSLEHNHHVTGALVSGGTFSPNLAGFFSALRTIITIRGMHIGIIASPQSEDAGMSWIGYGPNAILVHYQIVGLA